MLLNAFPDVDVSPSPILCSLSGKIEILCLTLPPSKLAKWDVKWCFQETEFKGEIRFRNCQGVCLVTAGLIRAFSMNVMKFI